MHSVPEGAPVGRLLCFPMLGQNIFIWNARGLNMRARRAVVREFLLQKHVSVLCLVETKLDVLLPCMASDLMGTSFDYVCLPSVGASGGIVVAWHRDARSVSGQAVRVFSVSICLQSSEASSPP